MENNISLEQPDIQQQSEHNVNEQINNVEEVSNTSSLDNGSNFGKFKDATSLLNAYNNLEKEFTKKSQKLSELMKSNSTNQIDDIDTEKLETEQDNTKQPTYMFNNKNWQTEVTKFFDKNPEAIKYKKDISNILLNDKVLAQHENCLEYAYALLCQKNQVKPADLLNDPNHLEDIYNNETIKNNIISNYLKGINENKNNIRFISGEPKSISPTRPLDKPKTLQEASKILKKLLET